MIREVKIGSITVGGNAPPVILGVVNISPESFYSDSFIPCHDVSKRVSELRTEGVDIIDIGARSTALNAPSISAAEERERVCTALKELDGCGIPLSIDTCREDVLDRALRYNIDLINDISGLANPSYARIASDAGLPVIAMATHTIPGDPLDFTSTLSAMKTIIDRASAFEIENLILDPGIGKWVPERSSEADWELCQRFDELLTFGYPLLAAVSRKRFIGDSIGKPAENRLFGTLGVLYHLIESGAHMLRVHDVAATRDLVSVYTSLKQKYHTE